MFTQSTTVGISVRQIEPLHAYLRAKLCAVAAADASG